MLRRFASRVPGFRTRRAWKMALATVGYGFVVLMIVAAVATSYVSYAAFGASALVVALLAVDAGGVRARIDTWRRDRLGVPARVFWPLVVVALISFSVAVDAAIPADMRANRDRRAQELRDAEAQQAAARAVTTLTTPLPVLPGTATPTVTQPPTSSPAPIAPTPTPSAPPATFTPTAAPTPVDLTRFIPPLVGYTQPTAGGNCSASRTSAGCFYVGPARPGATTATASVSVTLLGSEAEARNDLPSSMHHVDEAPVDLGPIVATGAWRPSVSSLIDPSYMIGFTYGRLVVVIDVQRVSSTRTITMDWAKKFGLAYVSSIIGVAKP